jgi:hypothetical protein
MQIFGILGVNLFAGRMWSCNCSHVYPPGVTPDTVVFDDRGGWADAATGRTSAELGLSIALVETKQQCLGIPRNWTLGDYSTHMAEHVDWHVFGVDPSFPDAVSRCFWDNRPYNFDTVPNAMMSLFTASTLAGWTDIMEIAMDSTGIGNQPVPFSFMGAGLFFLSYVMVMAFFVTNLFIGVLIDFIGHSDGTALHTDAQQKLLDLKKFSRLHKVAHHTTRPLAPPYSLHTFLPKAEPRLPQALEARDRPGKLRPELVLQPGGVQVLGQPLERLHRL